MYSDASKMEKTPYRALLDSQDWGEIYVRLFDFANGRCRRADQASDLAHEAMARVLDGKSTWDPAKEPKLLKYLMSVVNSLHANERTSAAEQRNVRLEKSRREAERVVDDRSFSVDKLADVTIYERRIALLKKRLANDVEATRILELTMAGEDTPADLCRATRWTATIVNAARLRMHRRAAEVAQALGHVDEPEEPPHLDAARGADDEHEEGLVP